jgi:tRNA dimethylallyltransferase
MWSAGWPGEVEGLLNRGVSTLANCFRAIGYREIAAFLAGDRGDAETRADIARKTRALVKRQRTWLATETGLTFVAPEAALETVRGGIGR